MQIINILDWINCDEIGEAEILSVISDFSCAINPEVNNFIHERAIDFAKRKTAITYFVTNDGSYDLVGFFTVAHKSIVIKEELLSKTDKRKIKQYAVLNDDGEYVVSAFLIAQIARNFKANNGSITGEELLNASMYTIERIQHMVGGRVVILECEKSNSKLIEFYESNGFHKYDTRIAQDKTEYIIFLSLI